MNKKAKKGILLVQLGTPDSPKTSDLKKYLTQFLMDPRVMDIPYINRSMLVKGIIVPRRAPKSAATYATIWGEATATAAGGAG
jgi:ferrochelatase